MHRLRNKCFKYGIINALHLLYHIFLLNTTDFVLLLKLLIFRKTKTTHFTFKKNEWFEILKILLFRNNSAKCLNVLIVYVTIEVYICKANSFTVKFTDAVYVFIKQNKVKYIS